jgi:hypothetical protein
MTANIEDIRNSIVAILYQDKIVGTGFVTTDGYLLTCLHVLNFFSNTTRQSLFVEKTTQLQVVLHDGSTQLADVIKVTHAEVDLMMLRLQDRNNIPGLRMGVIKDTVAHEFISFSFPGIGRLGSSVASYGKILGTFTLKEIQYLQLSHSMERAGILSGAPVIDRESNLVVGMFVQFREPQKDGKFNNLGFALTSEEIQKAFPEVKLFELRKQISQAINESESAENIPIEESFESGNGNEPPVPPTITEQTEEPEPLPSESTTELSDVIKPYTVTEDALDKHAATDKPIQNIKQDKLDFKIYVNALHSFILSKDTTTPITISIDGVWGSGKSSLMSMLRGKLDPQRDGVRKFFEWWWLLWSRIKWYGRFLKSVLPKCYGKTLITLTVRNDLDEPGIQLYFGNKVKFFKKHISNIVDGFAIDPEVLQAENEINALELPDHPKSEAEKDKDNIRWWAQVHANCEPMEPPYHYAVWLNAWKFDNQEEVWASLALATMEQIKQKHGLFWRLRFWWDLTFSRFSFWSGLWQVVKQFLLPLIFAVVLASYNVIIESVTVPLDAFKDYGSPLLWAGFVISGILAVSSVFKDPFQIPLDKVFDRPNYKDKVKFLSHFEKDFARIVRAATKNGLGWKPSKLVIFIDDLDRCEPPKSADIVEAVNLFLDAEGCVFVIGMDSESVSKSVEVKYKDLFERMKAENTGVVSLGRSFLDKIVQIPFSVPRATPSQITRMVEDSIGMGLRDSWDLNVQKLQAIKSDMEKMEAEDAQNAADKSQEANVPPATVEPLPNIVAPRIDPASYAKPEVQAAILAGTKLLADNPRQVKTFINLFRLSIYIANERKILEEKVTAEQTSGLNLEKLAMWTACSVRWQSLVRHFHTDAQTDSLRIFLLMVSETVSPTFTWVENAGVPDTLILWENISAIPVSIKSEFTSRRNNEKNSEAHWCQLPWEWWLLEPDFLKTIKSLQDLWRPKSTDETDWLEVLLTMTRPIS